jgi:hypothetical protein
MAFNRYSIYKIYEWYTVKDNSREQADEEVSLSRRGTHYEK